jgi:hypothetical protein
MSEMYEASFSVLAISIASSATMALGLAPHPTGEISKDKNMARFNINLLLMLQQKTQKNLSAEESALLTNIINDLQMKYLQA